MITPEEFPYIKSLYVNNCYTYKDFSIELHNYKPFSHLILTGKNGSGKSTILRSVNRQLFSVEKDRPRLGATTTVLTTQEDGSKIYKESTVESVHRSFVDISLSEKYYKNDKNNLMSPSEALEKLSSKIYSYFEAKRGHANQQVEGPTKESDFINKLNSKDSTKYFTSSFKQYLVNKKIEQAFAQIDQKVEQLMLNQAFFEELRLRFSDVLGQPVISLDYDHSNHEVYFSIEGKRRLTIETLSDGAFALFSILMDLFIRVDLIRKKVNNYIYNPCGIVLIDEPETHLHLQLQEQVLPLLTSLFPNVQFIVATHSPAVIASIRNATIFDLTTKESRSSEETVGRSYSELMRAHFGLDNEYSGIADELFRKVDQIIKEHKKQPEELKMKLQHFFVENEAYLSPTFRVELESMILENI